MLDVGHVIAQPQLTREEIGAAVFIVLQGLCWMSVLALGQRSRVVVVLAALLAARWSLLWVRSLQELAAAPEFPVATAVDPTILLAITNISVLMAASAVFLACAALHRPVLTAAAALCLLSAQLVQVGATAASSQAFWGVWWTWEPLTIMLLPFHAALLLAILATVFSAWWPRGEPLSQEAATAAA